MTRTTAFRACIAALVGLAALGGAGCRPRVVSIDDARVARYTENLVRHAARDTGCHASQLVPQRIAVQPAVFTVTGCAQPIEYWLRCRRNYCSWRHVPTLNEAAVSSLQCPAHAIQQQLTEAPNVRMAVGCGRAQPFTIVCNGVACGWAPSGPAQVTASVAVAPAPTSAQPAVAVAPPAPAPQPPSAVLQTQVQQQREAILSCVDSAAITLRLRWTPDGQVIVQLPPELLGTAAEGCVQAVLGGLRVVAQGAGEIVVPIQ